MLSGKTIFIKGRYRKIPTENIGLGRKKPSHPYRARSNRF